jgi:hypothetical protein
VSVSAPVWGYRARAGLEAETRLFPARHREVIEPLIVGAGTLLILLLGVLVG